MHISSFPPAIMFYDWVDLSVSWIFSLEFFVLLEYIKEVQNITDVGGKG